MQSRRLPVASQAYTNSRYTKAEFSALCEQARTAPDEFWHSQASELLDWTTPWDRVSDCSFDKDNVRVSWFPGGELNVAVNACDRHAAVHPDKTAIIWEPDNDEAHADHISYARLTSEVKRFANILEKLGVTRSAHVVIYLPMIPEAIYAMLACARIGAVHAVVFSGFSDKALAGRIQDLGAKFVITADFGARGGKFNAIKPNVDSALEHCPSVEKTLIIKRGSNNTPTVAGRDFFYEKMMAEVTDEHEAQSFPAEDPLFVLYTSGSTGKPKGLQHGIGGYAVYAAFTYQTSFDARPDDVFWCTADVGWITGHTYLTYGPLLSGATMVMHEGVPNYPDHDRWWKIIDKHNVSVFYTAPTAIRALRGKGDAYLETSSRSSLRLLGTVGEPINPDAWEWYRDAVGHSVCPIADTWWQTETGGHLITSVPGIDAQVPGCAGRPLPGIIPVLIDGEGSLLRDELSDDTTTGKGALCLAQSWPGQAQTVFGDHARFVETYFSAYPGYYFSGDGACREDGGMFRITGRMDDILNVSGHRLGTEEIESALVSHKDVAEAAVVGIPHDVKGEAIYCFVTLNNGVEVTDALAAELRQLVRTDIGAVATPEAVQLAPDLPKTRSGKIMRRILRKIASGETKEFGDVNTLVNPECIDALIAGVVSR